jgi:hypothetical protein
VAWSGEGAMNCTGDGGAAVHLRRGARAAGPCARLRADRPPGLAMGFGPRLKLK